MINYTIKGAMVFPQYFAPFFYFMKCIIIKSKKYGDKECWVDNKNYIELNTFKWRLLKGKSTFYAVAHIGETQNVSIYMHRHIMKETNPKYHVDHKDHNGLNNQKYNLRIAHNGENSKNKTSLKNSSSKYLGVVLRDTTQRWQAKITANGKCTHLGYFKKEIDAAKAYDKAAKLIHGEWANLNFKT